MKTNKTEEQNFNSFTFRSKYSHKFTGYILDTAGIQRARDRCEEGLKIA